MKRMRTIFLFLAVAAVPSAFAQCEVSSNLNAGGLSAEALVLRGAIYQELCGKVGGDLVDAQDVDTAKRLVFPDRPRNDAAPGENIAKQIMKLKAPVVLVYILERNGKASWAAVLESSGDKRVDAAAVAMARALLSR